MIRLRLQSQGFFGGQFILTDENKTWSIGDCIKVTLLDDVYDSGEKLDTPRGKLSISAFPLAVLFVAEVVQAILMLPIGVAAKHWFDCLVVGQIHTVKPRIYEYREHVWYYPEIDGRYPGMREAMKAAS